MFGRYKLDAFHPERITQFCSDLKSMGLDASVTWERNGKAIEPGSDHTVNSAKVRLDGAVVVEQFKRQGIVRFNAIPVARRQSILELLTQHGFVSEPNYGLGFTFAALFVAYKLFLYSTVSVSPDWLMAIALGGDVAWVLGLALNAAAHSYPEHKTAYKVSWLFIFVGIVLTVPAGLLFLPLLFAIARARLYRATAGFRVESNPDTSDSGVVNRG